LCPDAPGDNDLRPGTWTRRHRSQVVSVRNLAKSNSKKRAERVGEDHAGPDTDRSCHAKHGGPSRIKEPVCDSQIAICEVALYRSGVKPARKPIGCESGGFTTKPANNGLQPTIGALLVSAFCWARLRAACG